MRVLLDHCIPKRFGRLEPYAASVLQVLGEALACEMIRVESPGIVIRLSRDEIEV